jgi:hypothetical protein
MLRRTRGIHITMLAALAAAACDESSADLKHCVDENGVVQDESNCADAGTATPGTTGGGHFFWYYGGSSTPVTRGTRITGGSYTPSTGRSYSPPSSYHGGGSTPTIGRGGFGGTGEGFGGGGS